MSACIQSLSFMRWLYRMNSICRHYNHWNTIWKESDYHFDSSLISILTAISIVLWGTHRKPRFPRFLLKRSSTEHDIACSVDGIRFQRNWPNLPRMPPLSSMGSSGRIINELWKHCENHHESFAKLSYVITLLTSVKPIGRSTHEQGWPSSGFVLMVILALVKWMVRTAPCGAL